MTLARLSFSPPPPLVPVQYTHLRVTRTVHTPPGYTNSTHTFRGIVRTVQIPLCTYTDMPKKSVRTESTRDSFLHPIFCRRVCAGRSQPTRCLTIPSLDERYLDLSRQPRAPPAVLAPKRLPRGVRGLHGGRAVDGHHLCGGESKTPEGYVPSIIERVLGPRDNA